MGKRMISMVFVTTFIILSNILRVQGNDPIPYQVVRPRLECDAVKGDKVVVDESSLINEYKDTPFTACLLLCTLKKDCVEVAYDEKEQVCFLLKLAQNAGRLPPAGNGRLAVKFGNIKCFDDIEEAERKRLFSRRINEEPTKYVEKIYIEDHCCGYVDKNTYPRSYEIKRAERYVVIDHILDYKHCLDMCRAYGLVPPGSKAREGKYNLTNCNAFSFNKNQTKCELLKFINPSQPEKKSIVGFDYHHDIICGNKSYLEEHCNSSASTRRHTVRPLTHPSSTESTTSGPSTSSGSTIPLTSGESTASGPSTSSGSTSPSTSSVFTSTRSSASNCPSCPPMPTCPKSPSCPTPTECPAKEHCTAYDDTCGPYGLCNDETINKCRCLDGYSGPRCQLKFVDASIPQASAVIFDPTGKTDIRGFFLFHMADSTGRTNIFKGNVRGLTDGYHGIHIHEGTDIHPNCSIVRKHFNVNEINPHGLPTVLKSGAINPDRHYGDYGNVYSNGSTATFQSDVKDDKLAFVGPHSVFHRTLVISERKDLGKNYQPDGNSGPPVACGIIQPRLLRAKARLSIPGESTLNATIDFENWNDLSEMIISNMGNLANGTYQVFVRSTALKTQNCEGSRKYYVFEKQSSRSILLGPSSKKIIFKISPEYLSQNSMLGDESLIGRLLVVEPTKGGASMCGVIKPLPWYREYTNEDDL